MVGRNDECDGVISSALNDNDWEECPACSASGCPECNGVGWHFVRDNLALRKWLAERRKAEK